MIFDRLCDKLVPFPRFLFCTLCRMRENACIVFIVTMMHCFQLSLWAPLLPQFLEQPNYKGNPLFYPQYA